MKVGCSIRCLSQMTVLAFMMCSNELDGKLLCMLVRCCSAWRGAHFGMWIFSVCVVSAIDADKCQDRSQRKTPTPLRAATNKAHHSHQTPHTAFDARHRNNTTRNNGPRNWKASQDCALRGLHHANVFFCLRRRMGRLHR